MFDSIDDYRKIGIGLSMGGLLFTTLGVFMFFDRGLLAMGNVRSTQHHPASSGQNVRMSRSIAGAHVL